MSMSVCVCVVEWRREATAAENKKTKEEEGKKKAKKRQQHRGPMTNGSSSRSNGEPGPNETDTKAKEEPTTHLNGRKKTLFFFFFRVGKTTDGRTDGTDGTDGPEGTDRPKGRKEITLCLKEIKYHHQLHTHIFFILDQLLQKKHTVRRMLISLEESGGERESK